jgi:hypothetical protein
MGDAQYWWYDYGDGELGRQLNDFYKKHADCVYRENGVIDNYTIEFEFPTNANKIRAMTDEELYGKGSAVWASEVEPFPIAVTKERFPDAP